MRGLVLHFDFAAKPVAEKIPDLSGQGNTGEAVGVQWVSGGHRGGSIVFGPTNNYIRVPNSDSLNPSNITLAVWIKTDNHGNTARRIFDKGYSDGYAMSIGGYSKPAPAQDRSFVEIGMKINDNKGCTGSEKPVTDGRWHHLATTYNGAETFFYVDGVPQKQWGGHWDGKVPANSHDLTLGQNCSTPNADFGEVGASFNGMMDDTMIFNRALSAEEIQKLYDLQKSAQDAFPANIEIFALHKAAYEGNLEEVKALIAKGVDVNAQWPKNVNATPLFFAVSKGHENIRGIFDTSGFKKINELKFSAHAQTRIKSRDIDMTPQVMEKLTNAVDSAQSKGSKNSLVLFSNAAFIVNVPTRTVVTAMDGENIRENIFTNIDSTVLAG